MDGKDSKEIRVAQISTGFVEIPNNISMNIYAQGCKLHCPGCQNLEVQNFDGGVSLNYSQIKQAILDHSLCTWICWLGGDATFQPEPFTYMNRMIKMDFPSMKICLYTGQYFDVIKNLLGSVDLVIDGPWKGIPITDNNSNQKIYINDRNGWKSIDCWDTLVTMMKSI